MNYDLALKLKEHGFPDDICEWTDELPDRKSNTVVPIPTLSELISACGDRFNALQRMWVNVSGLEPTWCAYSRHDNDIEAYRFTEGSSPEEAVANLYCALNPKK